MYSTEAYSKGKGRLKVVVKVIQCQDNIKDK